jgi:hypothetical protein
MGEDDTRVVGNVVGEPGLAVCELDLHQPTHAWSGSSDGVSTSLSPASAQT